MRNHQNSIGNDSGLGQGVFLLWHLFARAPVIAFWIFLCCRPRVCKVFFLLLRPVGRRDLSAGPEQKKASPRVFFFALAPCRCPTGFSFPCLSPGPEPKNKNLGGVFVFLRWPRAQQKRHFAHPGTTATKIKETNDTGHEQKGATKKKKTTHSLRPWTAMLTHFFSGATFPAGPGWCFFLLRPRADAHSLTAGLGGDASRRGGIFFLLRPRPDLGGVFFLLWPRPDAHSLTHCGLGRFRQGPGGAFFFFCCGPAEPGEPITKNV